MIYLKKLKFWGIVSAIVLFVIAGLIFFNVQEQREQMRQALSQYHSNILAQAPCIASVCPGLKGHDKVVKFFSDNGLSIYAQKWVITYQINPDNSLGSVRLNENEIVTQISLRLDDLTLGTVLNVLGEPEYLLAIFGCGVGSRVRVKLLYPTQGIEITLDVKTKQRVSLSLDDNMEILDIIYFLPDDYYDHMIKSIENDYLLATEFGSSSKVITATELFQKITTWQGLDSPINVVDICLN